LHSGVVKDGKISIGSQVQCKVDYDRRRDVAPNHSMTHVLNAALRKVLGDGVEQRGSLCNDEKLRFDFSHKKAMTPAQLTETESICQQAVAAAEPVTSEIMPLETAKAIPGVRAVFGEVYPDPVRVVSVGSELSVEFCGGTHIANTAEAESFVVVEETAVAKGIRRISAVTKGAAQKAIEEGKIFEERVSDLEKVTEDITNLDKQAGAIRKDLDEAFLSAPLKSKLRTRLEALQKKAMDAKKKALAARVEACIGKVEEEVQQALEQNKPTLVVQVDIETDGKAAQKIMNAAKSLAPELAFMGLSGDGQKLMCFAIVPDSMHDSLKANEWVQATLAVCGGRGGGKPGNAQGQAPSYSSIQEVADAANEFASKMSVGTAA